MALANYSDLQASIANWMHRSDLTLVIPDFIVLAEKRINGDLDARLQDSIAILTTVPSVTTTSIPADVINIRSLTLQSSPNVVLNYLTPDQFNYQYRFATSGVPASFSVIGSLIYYGPTPDSAYPVQCVYKAMLSSLSALNTTNVILTSYPQVYLNAARIEAAKYLSWPEEKIAELERNYAEAIKSVNSTDWYSGSTLRVRQDVRM